MCTCSEKRPQSRDEDWDPNDENESLNGCILPTLTTRISTMLLVPLRHRVHRDEARKLRAQLGGKDDGGDSDDSDEEYLEKHDKQYADATWGVLAAINREKSHEQDKQLTVQ